MIGDTPDWSSWDVSAQAAPIPAPAKAMASSQGRHRRSNGAPRMWLGVGAADTGETHGLIRSHRIRSPSYHGRGFLFGDRLWPRKSHLSRLC